MPSNVLARLLQSNSGKPSLLATAIMLAFSGNLHAAGVPTLQEVTVSSGAHDLTGVADSATELSLIHISEPTRPY